MEKKEEEKKQVEQPTDDAKEKTGKPGGFGMPASFAAVMADEIAKTLVQRLPHMIAARRERSTAKKKAKTIENGIFLDTSAIIDGRIFEVANIGLLNGIFVIPESILLELKHIADSQDMVKRERGRGGLEALDKLKKSKKIKVTVVPHEEQKDDKKKKKEVDEQLIDIAKHYKGKIITCDYNLEKKASIHGVTTINMNALAQCLKISAVPGESLHIKVLHPGKDITQGVGYLDDGTMLVIEQGSSDVGKMVDVVVSRVIQTVSGRILFAKKI